MAHSFENKHNMFCIQRPMEVVTVPHGIVLPQIEVENGPMWGLGGVCDAEGNFVNLSAYDGGWATHGGAYPWQDEVYMDCDAVYFGMFFNHWGHFLIDLMGRLWYFVKHHNPCVKLVYLGEETPRKNFLEVFDLLGISESDLLQINRPTRFRNVIVPEFSCKSCRWYSREYLSIFDTMIRKTEAEDAAFPHLQDLRRVYFSRRAFGKARRSEFGEENIVCWLERNGFTSVAPETLSVREQIYLWNHAEEIVCLDGSIPMSVAFSNNSQLTLTILHKSSLEHLNVELFLLMRPCNVTFLDAWHEPFRGYPRNIGAGPFLLCLGADAREYSAQKGWVFPFTEAQLRLQKYKGCIKLAWRIADLDSKAHILLSKLLPRSVKDLVRRWLRHG